VGKSLSWIRVVRAAGAAGFPPAAPRASGERRAGAEHRATDQAGRDNAELERVPSHS